MALLNKIGLGGGPKKARGGDETYASDLAVFNEMNARVKAIDVSLATYEKKVAAVAPALRSISVAFTALYTDPTYQDHATSFESSYQTVNGAVAAFQTQQAETRKILADYLVRLKALDKSIDQHDALHSDMINREKTMQKAKPKDVQLATEKYNASKDAYTVKHLEVSKELRELVENKYEDLELVFTSVVSSQQKLFSQMSNSFDIPQHGISKSKPAAHTPSPAQPPAVPRTEAPPPRSGSAPAIPPSVVPPSNYTAPPPAVPAQQAPPPIPSYSEHHDAPPAPARSEQGPPPINRDYQAAIPPPVPAQTAAPPLPAQSAPPPLPVYDAHAPPPVPSHSAPPAATPGKLSIVSPMEREKFEALFHREESKEGKGVLNGELVFDMFSRSGLSNDDLGQIWELSDQDLDGCLDLEEFVLAMFLINAKLRGQITAIPATLPPEYTIHK